MADEEIITPPAAEAEGSEPVEAQDTTPAEGSEAPGTEAQPEARYSDEPEAKKQPDSVPLHVHKETRDKLKAEIRELREKLAQSNPSEAKLEQIASKWGVDVQDVKELAESIKGESVREAESKFGSVIEEQKKAKVDAAFDSEFQKLVKDYPQLEGKKDVIKNLAFTKQYVKTPLPEIAQQVFGDLLGKGGVEQARPSSDKGGEVVDFTKMTPEQKSQVLKDPEARKRYYDFLDKTTSF